MGQLPPHRFPHPRAHCHPPVLSSPVAAGNKAFPIAEEEGRAGTDPILQVSAGGGPPTGYLEGWAMQDSTGCLCKHKALRVGAAGGKQGAVL